MKVLQIQLYSGAWRYITDIVITDHVETDICCSIYSSRALPATPDNINSAFNVLDKLDSYKTINIREI